MSFDSAAEAAARRLARPHTRRGFLGMLGGTLTVLGIGSFSLASDATGQSATTFTLVNNTGQTIWPAALGNAGQQVPGSGGWELAAGQSIVVILPSTWAGKFWARTYCTFDAAGQGSCETGDCGGALACNGAGGAPTASLAEFTLGGGSSADFYDVSYVDAFNVPITVAPAGGAANPAAPYQCTTAGCSANLNPGCPGALQQIDLSGNIAACLSACQVFGIDQFCCAGAYASPSACNPASWPVDYPAYFKSACPGAYSYPFDDPTSTFACSGATGYTITFWPISAIAPAPPTAPPAPTAPAPAPAPAAAPTAPAIPTPQ